MTEFIVSLVVIFGAIRIYHWYEKRTPITKRFTWGEAMIATTYVFGMLFMANGVVPHFWLQWADSGLQWRADVILQGPHIPFISPSLDVFDPEGNLVGTEPLGIIASQQDGGWFPFRIPYLIIRDLVSVLIYNVFLGATIFYWHHWQSRATRIEEEAKTVDPPSEFGRPLIREGAR